MAVADHADLYDVAQSGAGPASTVIAFNLGTFHRGTGSPSRAALHDASGLPTSRGRVGPAAGLGRQKQRYPELDLTP